MATPQSVRPLLPLPLQQRRAANPAAENAALVALAVALGEAPGTALQVLADHVVALLKVGSAGVGVHGKGGVHASWAAVAGRWQSHPELADLAATAPAAEPCLVVPFGVAGKTAGTVWAVAHDPGFQFDAEDLRLLQDLARFALPAVHAVGMLNSGLDQPPARAPTLDIHDTLYTLIENAPFGIYVIDAQFRMCQASAATRRAFASVQSLLGRDFGDIVRTAWPEPMASDVLARFGHTLKTGEPYVAQTLTEPRKDLPDLESYDWKIERITLPDGTFGVVCYFYDVTEREHAQAELRSSEARFRTFVTASADAAYRMSPDWHEMRQLQGRDFTDDTSEPRTDWMQEFIHPQDQPKVRAAIDAAIDAKGIFELEHRVVRVDGETGWTRSRAVPLLGADGAIVEWFGTASDVTAARQAQQALDESEQRYRDLFNAMDEG